MDYDWDWIEFIDYFGEKWHFDNLEATNHEHDTSCHLFKSSLIFLSNVLVFDGRLTYLLLNLLLNILCCMMHLWMELFLISFSSLLLVHRHTIKFYVLTLYLKTWLNVKIHNLFVYSFVFSTFIIMLTVNRDSFTSLSVFLPFISCYCTNQDLQ